MRTRNKGRWNQRQQRPIMRGSRGDPPPTRYATSELKDGEGETTALAQGEGEYSFSGEKDHMKRQIKA